MNNQIDCPVDLVSVNEHKVRLIAFFTMLLTASFLLTSFWPIIVFLTIDFFLRAFKWGSYSVLGFISDKVIALFKIGVKPVDRAPKRFAAMVGLFFTVIILALLAFGFAISAGLFAAVLIFFAFLESVLGFCAGCYVYALGKKIFNKI